MVISGAKLHKDICIHTMASIELRFQNGRREDTFLTLMEQATTKNVHTILYLATGQLLAALGSSGQLWVALGSSGQLWSALGSYWQLLAALGSSG